MRRIIRKIQVKEEVEYNGNSASTHHHLEIRRSAWHKKRKSRRTFVDGNRGPTEVLDPPNGDCFAELLAFLRKQLAPFFAAAKASAAWAALELPAKETADKDLVAAPLGGLAAKAQGEGASADDSTEGGAAEPPHETSAADSYADYVR